MNMFNLQIKIPYFKGPQQLREKFLKPKSNYYFLEKKKVQYYSMCAIWKWLETIAIFQGKPNYLNIYASEQKSYPHCIRTWILRAQ